MYKEQLEIINNVLPEVGSLMEKELEDQRSHLKMIASENYCSPAVRAAMSSIFTDKYSEGYPYHRYYEGCENADALESLAIKLACDLFGADYANVQPHCGSDANMLAYWTVLDAKILTPKFEELKRACSISLNHKEVKTYNDLTREEWNYFREACHNQKLLAMDYYSGSHLTHGYRQNISAQLFDVHYYKVGNDGLLDYDEIERQAMEVRPLILLAGYSAYPRKIDFKRFREIADKCGAVLMVDMAHFAGLVAGRVFKDEYNPVLWADIVTSTTHKTLRGPRGGLVLCKEWLRDSLNKGCPLVMGGALQNIIAAKAICFKEALSEEYREYAKQIVKNSQTLATTLKENNIKVLTGGTDNHIVMIDVSPFGLTGRQVESALRECGIICNRNSLPNDPNGPWYTSGIRLGTPALTTLGMKEKEMEAIGKSISSLLKNIKPSVKDGKKSKVKYEIEGYPESEKAYQEVRDEVVSILKKFPAYPDLK